MSEAGALQIRYAHRRELTDDFVARYVSAEDRQDCESTTHPRRRAERLAGRALLRYALEQYTGHSAASLSLRVTREGKPECENGPAISLSHSGDVLVCAVADRGAIGVDVETRTPNTSVGALAAQYFTPFETAWLESAPDSRFQMLWVLKEAYLKALGVGLAGGLRSLECRIAPPLIEARVAAGAPPQLALYAGPGSHVGIAWHAAPRGTIRIAPCAGAHSHDTCGPFELIAATP